MTTLEKIRAEFISRYPKNYANEAELGGASCFFSLIEVLQIIDKYAEQEPCDDTALERQTEKICQYRDEDGYCWTDEKCKYQSNDEVFCQKQDDTISRQAVLDLQYRIDDSATLSTRDVVNVEDIEDLPSVRPQPCEDAVSRQYLLDLANKDEAYDYVSAKEIAEAPSVRPQEQTGHCKDCKYFEYDSVAKVDGVPLIVAHEICNKWGDGCKTKEDGYCFLFEPQESEE